VHTSYVGQLDRLLTLGNSFIDFYVVLHSNSFHIKRGKRGFNCNKQVERVMTVLNHMLKGLWREVGSGGIRKKLKD